ncbi:MAG: D-glycero-beta-D-manno-heptose-7-phosphate kinase [Candidatus Omnitrophica bacterium]|nr:D-glycero-beta-D-manno-heptose-7-phosphate kinase [Candidatus Omnitrophota bacterium]
MKNLKKIIGNFSRARILVVGDLILDQYIHGAVDRVSPEAPVPVVWANKRFYVPGGAANVANNIRALDAEVSLVGVLGRDAHARILLSELKKRRVDTRGIFTEAKRQTILKTRVIAGHQQVVRVDWEDCRPLSEAASRKVAGFIRRNIERFDAIIIEDYGKGVINQRLLEELVRLARSHRKIITVDPKEEHFQYYRRVTSITPNRKELENAVRNLKIKDTANKFRVYSDRLFTDRDIEDAARQVREYLDLDSVLVTLGEQGMKLFEKSGRMTYIPTVAQEVFDVSGAGDTVIATFTLGLAAGANLREAASIANFAAGIVVGKAGTAVATRKELLERTR